MGLGKYLGLIIGVIGGIVGGIVGGIYGGPAGAFTGASLGFSIGGLIGGVSSSIFWPEKSDLNLPPPPQPHETRLQFSSWGMPIPIQYGSGRMAGNIIYMSDIGKTIERSKDRQDGVRYYEMTKTYTATVAIAFCEGPIKNIARIWMNNKVIVDYRDPNAALYPGDGELAAANLDTSIARQESLFRIYHGTEDQVADPSISALIGAAETPAYKGLCYLVFIDFPIGEFSGVPNFEVEIEDQPLDREIETTEDDVEWNENTNAWVVSGNNSIRFGVTSSGFIGLFRFHPIRIQQGYPIQSATMRWTCSQRGTIDGRYVHIRIKIVASDDAVMPTDGGASADGLVYVSNTVDFDGNTESKVVGTTYYTPDISAPLQQVISRPGWQFGNAILVALWFVEDCHGQGFWAAASFDHYLEYDPPKLIIT